MTLSKYIIGLVISLVLTLTAYFVVVGGIGSGIWLLVFLGALAIAQMIVQLAFFLHLGEETKPRFKLWSFVVMAIMLLIIVVGSIWIMENMNYNMMHMTSDQKTQYMIKEHGKGF